MYLNKSEKFKPKEIRRKETIKQKMRQTICNRKLKKNKVGSLKRM